MTLHSNMVHQHEYHLTPVRKAFRMAKRQTNTGHSLVSDPRVIFHSLHPHPALSPVPSASIPSTIVDQRENESAWRQLLVQGVLTVLLPTEDLENSCLRALVAEIFAEMILGNGISGKACEGWLLWEGITRVAEVLQARMKEEAPRSETTPAEHALTRLERYGLLSPPVADENGSTKPQTSNGRHHEDRPMTFTGLIWAVIQYAFLAGTAMRAAIVNIATAPSLPARSITATSGQSPVEASRQSQLPQAAHPASRRPLASKRPILSMQLWSCASQLADLNSRMPWLSGLISMLHWVALAGPGRVGDTDGVLDR